MAVIVNPAIAGVGQAGRIPIIQRTGTVASPLATISASTGAAFTLPANIILPPGIIPQNSQVRCRAVVQRTGATAVANLDTYLGTAGTTADARVARIAFAATTLQIIVLETTAWFGTSASTFVSQGGLTINNAATSGQFGDQTTNVNTAAQMQYTIAINGSNAADSFALISYEVWIET